MPQTKSRASSNGRSTSTSRPSTARKKSGSSNRSRSSPSSGAVRSTAGKTRAKPQNAASKGPSQVADTASSAVSGAGRAVKAVIVPVASAAAGAAAGVVLARRNGQRRRKVLGIPMPSSTSGLEDLASTVTKAGKEFGRLAGEVRAAREKAEQVGKALK